MSKEYSYNKKKLKSKQGRAIYGLLGQQLGGMGAVIAGGTKGNILGRYAAGSVAGMGAGYLAGAHLPVGGGRQLDYTVERAVKQYKKTGKKNATFRDLEKNHDLKLSKQDKLTEDFILHHRRLDHLTPMEAFNSYTKTLRKLPSSDRQRFKSMYKSRHGSLPTRRSALLDEQELRELKALSKQAALENFYMYKVASPRRVTLKNYPKGFRDKEMSALLHEGDKDSEIRGFVYPKDTRRARVGILQGGKMVGFFTPRKDPKGWRAGAIYISPEYRGKGVGAKALTKFFKNKEASPLPIGISNYSSRKSFINAGFYDTGERYVDPFDGWEATIFKQTGKKHA